MVMLGRSKCPLVDVAINLLDPEPGSERYNRTITGTLICTCILGIYSGLAPTLLISFCYDNCLDLNYLYLNSRNSRNSILFITAPVAHKARHWVLSGLQSRITLWALGQSKTGALTSISALQTRRQLPRHKQLQLSLQSLLYTAITSLYSPSAISVALQDSSQYLPFELWVLFLRQTQR